MWCTTSRRLLSVQVTLCFIETTNAHKHPLLQLFVCIRELLISRTRVDRLWFPVKELSVLVVKMRLYNFNHLNIRIPHRLNIRPKLKERPRWLIVHRQLALPILMVNCFNILIPLILLGPIRVLRCQRVIGHIYLRCHIIFVRAFQHATS